MAAQLTNNGRRVPEQANEHQDTEKRKCDQVKYKQYCPDLAVPEPHGSDGDDAGSHDERETASG
jgi:hypothetical protein